jgi:hypothetical protein
MQLPKPCNLDHFPLKISPVPEKVTLVELIEIIPDFLGIGLSLMIVFFRELGKVLLEFLL